MEGMNESVLTYEEKVSLFPWIQTVYSEFTKSFPADYEFGALKFFHMNVETELENISMKITPGRTKALFAILGDFYNLFCWKTKWAEPSPHMKMSCVQLLSDLIKVGLVLSKGSGESKWLNRILSAMNVFPGDKCLLYDALFLVSSLKKKYQNTYGIILRHILCSCKHEVKEPLTYFKIVLLFRRLKFLTADVKERSRILSFATRVPTPLNTASWLQSHNFDWNVEVHVIGRQLMGKCFDKSVLAKLREIIFPEVCFKQSHSLEENVPKQLSVNGSFTIDTAGQLPNEDGMEHAEDKCNMMTKKLQDLESGKKKKMKSKDINYLNENIPGPSKRRNEQFSETTDQSPKENKIKKRNKNQEDAVVGKEAVPRDTSPGWVPFTKTELQLAVRDVERKKSKKRKKEKVSIDSSDEPFVVTNSTGEGKSVSELEFYVSLNEPSTVTSVSKKKKKAKVDTRQEKEMHSEPSKKQIASDTTEKSHSASGDFVSRESSTKKHSKKSLTKRYSPIKTDNCEENIKLQNKIQLIRSKIAEQESEESFFEDRNPTFVVLKKFLGEEKKRSVEDDSKYQKIASECKVLDDSHNDSSENDSESSTPQGSSKKLPLSSQLPTPKKTSNQMPFQFSDDLNVSWETSKKLPVSHQQPTPEKTTKEMSSQTPDILCLSNLEASRKSSVVNAVSDQRPTPKKTSKEISSQTPENLYLSDQEASRKLPVANAVSDQQPTPKKTFKEMSSQTPGNLCLSPQEASSELHVSNAVILHSGNVDSRSSKTSSTEGPEVEKPSNKNQGSSVTEFDTSQKKSVVDNFFTSDEFFNEDPDEYIPCGQNFRTEAASIVDSKVLEPNSDIALNEECKEKREFQVEEQTRSLDIIKDTESDTHNEEYACEQNLVGSVCANLESGAQKNESLEQGVNSQQILVPCDIEYTSGFAKQYTALNDDHSIQSKALVLNLHEPLNHTSKPTDTNLASQILIQDRDQIMQTIHIEPDLKCGNECPDLEHNDLPSLSESMVENLHEQKRALNITDRDSDSESVNECLTDDSEFNKNFSILLESTVRSSNEQKQTFNAMNNIKSDSQSGEEHIKEESEPHENLSFLSESMVGNLDEQKQTMNPDDNIESYSKSSIERLGVDSESDKDKMESTIEMECNLEGVIENYPSNTKSTDNSCANEIHKECEEMCIDETSVPIKIEVESHSIKDSTEKNGQSEALVNNSFRTENKRDDCDGHHKVKCEIFHEKQSGSRQIEEELEIDRLTQQEHFLKNANLTFKESKSIQIDSCFNVSKQRNSEETVAGNDTKKENCTDSSVEMNSVTETEFSLNVRSDCSSTKLASQVVGIFYNKKSPELSEDVNQVELTTNLLIEAPSETDINSASTDSLKNTESNGKDLTETIILNPVATEELSQDKVLKMSEDVKCSEFDNIEEETDDIELRISTFNHTVNGHVAENNEPSLQISKFNVIKSDSDEDTKEALPRIENDKNGNDKISDRNEFDSTEIKKEIVSDFENDEIIDKNSSRFDSSEAQDISICKVENVFNIPNDGIETNYKDTTDGSVSRNVTQASVPKNGAMDCIPKEDTRGNLACGSITYLMEKMLTRVELADLAKKDSTFDVLKKNILKPAIKLTPLKETTLGGHGKVFKSETECLSYSDILSKEEMACVENKMVSDSFSSDSSIVNSPEFASYRDFNSDSPSIVSYFKATTVEKMDESEFLSEESLYDSDEGNCSNMSGDGHGSPGFTKDSNEDSERQDDITSKISDSEEILIPSLKNSHNDDEKTQKLDSSNCGSSDINVLFDKEGVEISTDVRDVKPKHLLQKMLSAVVNVGKRCDDKDFKCDENNICLERNVKASPNTDDLSKILGEVSNAVDMNDCSISMENNLSANRICEEEKNNFTCMVSVKNEINLIPHSPSGVSMNESESIEFPSESQEKHSLPDDTLIETSCITETSDVKPSDLPGFKSILSDISETNLASGTSLRRNLRRTTVSSRKIAKTIEMDTPASSGNYSLRRSSRRRRNAANLNLGFDFDQLSLNSPQSKDPETCSRNSRDSNDDVSLPKETMEQPSRGALSKRIFCASAVVPVVNPEPVQSETSAENYNLRSRRSVLRPGKLKL